MTLLLRTRELSDELYAAVDGCSTPATARELLAAGAHDAVHEHHRAIGLLVSENLCGSALALRRSMFDGCLRGSWLLHIATDSEVSRFANETYDPDPTKALKALEAKCIDGSEILRQFYALGWKEMSSYVHGSYRQIVSRLGADYVGPNHTDEDIELLLHHANWFSLLSAFELAEISKDTSFRTEVRSIAERHITYLESHYSWLTTKDVRLKAPSDTD